MKHEYGTSETVCQTDTEWVVRFDALAGSASTLHLHTKMVHHIYCLAGLIDVYVSDCLSARLDPGESFVVRAMIPHRLVFQCATIGREVYFAVPGETIDPGDVVKLAPGWSPKRYRAPSVGDASGESLYRQVIEERRADSL